jgi:hypothetical protein
MSVLTLSHTLLTFIAIHHLHDEQSHGVSINAILEVMPVGYEAIFKPVAKTKQRRYTLRPQARAAYNRQMENLKFD